VSVTEESQTSAERKLELASLPLVFWAIPVALLLMAHFRLPYGFYTLTRLVVLIEAAIVAWRFWKAGGKFKGAAVLFGLLALVFNPIIPVRLSRDQWAVIDPLVAAVFGVCALLVRQPWRRRG